jgi:dihydrofolate synthase/folylpolyglutamate synthase
LLLDELERPDLRYRRIHVVGTKGKGSTTAMLVGILEQSGFRVGMYTSPHLLDMSERIQVDRTPVPQAELLRIYSARVQPAIERLPSALGQPTYFEVLTILALEAFADAGVEVAVIEAGLGGKLDSTNAIAAPEVIVLVPISLDHTQILGSTVEQIAWDKTAVFKPGSAIVAAHQPEEVTPIVAAQAKRVGCRISWVDSEVHIRRQPARGSGQRLRLLVRGNAIEVKLPLAGRHQAENAATAALAAWALLSEDNDRSLGQGLRSASSYLPSRVAIQPRYRPADITSGLESVRLRGRFEYVVSTPPVIVDVAHNEASAKSLASTVSETQSGKVVYLVGLSTDKDAEAFFSALAPTASAFVCVEANHPRARNAEKLAEAARASMGGGKSDQEAAPRVSTASSVREGLHVARTLTGSTTTVVTGSFYVVAEALKLLDAAQ